jgi:hypothetical protein
MVLAVDQGLLCGIAFVLTVGQAMAQVIIEVLSYGFI